MANLLIIDDDSTSLLLLKAFLKTTDHNLFTATDGQEALNLINNKPPEFFSCIVTDYFMPNLDGIALTQKLKQDPLRKVIPIIMQTSASSEAEIQQGLDAGVFYYLLKPVTQSTLLSTLNAALKDYKNHTQTLQKLELFSASLNLLKNAYFEIRTVEQAQHLSNFIAYLTQDPMQIGVGLFELMLNAVEHGNLGITYDEKTALINAGNLENEIKNRLQDDKYKHKYVRVQLINNNRKLVVIISDMGAGFMHENYLDFSLERAMDNHGRGIMMANKLSFDKLIYSNGGTTVTCIKNVQPEETDTDPFSETD